MRTALLILAGTLIGFYLPDAKGIDVKLNLTKEDIFKASIIGSCETREDMRKKLDVVRSLGWLQ